VPRNLKPSELVARAGFIAAAGENATAQLPKVLKQLREWSTSAGGGASGPGPKNQVGRPTEAAALSVDEFARAREELVAALLTADAAMRQVERIRRWVMTPPPPAHPVERGLAKCCNPRGCPDDAWAEKAGRCDACYRFRLRTDRDRGPEPEPAG
jgi:hypothetical protein